MTLPLRRIGIAKVIYRGGEHSLWCTGTKHYVEQDDFPGVAQPDGVCTCAKPVHAGPPDDFGDEIEGGRSEGL